MNLWRRRGTSRRSLEETLSDGRGYVADRRPPPAFDFDSLSRLMYQVVSCFTISYILFRVHIK